jgi:hypothetical protein
VSAGQVVQDPEQYSDMSTSDSVTLHELISCQAASGIFCPTALQKHQMSRLLRVVAIYSDVSALLEALNIDITDMGDLHHTLTVVVYIKNQFAKEEELWELVIRKAENWVITTIADEDLREKMWESAQKAWIGQ